MGLQDSVLAEVSFSTSNCTDLIEILFALFGLKKPVLQQLSSNAPPTDSAEEPKTNRYEI